MQRPADQAYSQDLIQEALVSEFHPRTHEAFGEGGVHVFGGSGFSQCDLEVWPQARMVRFRSPTVAIALANQDPPVSIDPGRPFDGGSVCFVNETEAQHIVFLVQTSGEFILTGSTPRDQTDPAGPSVTDDDRLGGGIGSSINHDRVAPDSDPSSEPVERSDPAASTQGPSVEPVEGSSSGSAEYPIRQELEDQGSFQASASSPEPTDQFVDVNKKIEQPPKLRLTGELITAPVYRPPTPERPAHIRFPLLDASANANRHQIYSTKHNAERIAGLNLQPGEQVRVTGVQQEQSVYAYGVRRLSEEE